MNIRHSSPRALVIATLASACPAAVVFDTGAPDFGFFGPIGYDVFVGQSVGVSFVPDQSYALDDIGVWFMSNDFDNPGRTFTLTLRTDDGSSPGAPSGAVLESWLMSTTAIGWEPVLEVATSSLHPTLLGGSRYWVVAESSEQPFVDPVWAWGSNSFPVLSGNIDFASGPNWQTGYTYGSAPGTIVNGTAAPAPGALAALGLGGVQGCRRRRAR